MWGRWLRRGVGCLLVEAGSLRTVGERSTSIGQRKLDCSSFFVRTNTAYEGLESLALFSGPCFHSTPRTVLRIAFDIVHLLAIQTNEKGDKHSVRGCQPIFENQLKYCCWKIWISLARRSSPLQSN